MGEALLAHAAQLVPGSTRSGRAVRQVQNVLPINERKRADVGQMAAPLPPAAEECCGGSDHRYKQQLLGTSESAASAHREL